MLVKFWEGLGGKLAQRWLSNVLMPVLLFWAGGLAVWAWSQDGFRSLVELEKELGQFPQLMQGAILLAGLMGMSLLAMISQYVTLPILRFLEGYWPPWLQYPRGWLIRVGRYFHGRKEQRFQELALRFESLSPVEKERFIDLDAWLRLFPDQPEDWMPTRLGNLLRAAELRPRQRYGLEPVVCFPRLWLLLPDGVKKELAGARESLDTSARFWLWSILFTLWSLWSWWALVLGLVGAFVANRWLQRAAVRYATLLESAFDIYRFELYKALRWPLPAHAGEERVLGEQINEYLWRGSHQAETVFTPIPKCEDGA